MKLQKYISKLLDVLLAIVMLLFFASFGFRDGRTSGWYQQWFPNLNGSTITSMTFLDSLTGFAVTNSNSNNQSFILKTTNGGDNWNIQLTTYPNFNKIMFVDQNIGFASAYTDALFKTTNGGLNWFTLSNGGIFPNDMAVLNKDTILYVRSDIIDGGVYRTTNGGLSWQTLGPTGGSGQPGSIYMFNRDMGFCLGGQMRKTTNGGVNWFVIPGESYDAIKFFDTLIGWKTGGSSILQRTTNGGLNWIPQQLPNIGHAYSYTNFSVINKDTVWMIGNSYYFGLLYKTTNGGNNWGYQLADTSVHITLDRLLCFVNNKIGWASSIFYNSEIHTKTAGNDTTFFTSVNNNSSIIPDDYILFQNYPNPFNSKSNIKYEIKKAVRNQESEIRIVVYNISGKQVSILVNGIKKIGKYEVNFDGNNLASGIYFYSLFADGIRIDTKKMIFIK